MKLSFSTLGCPDWSFAQVLENARAMGFSGIEVRGLEGRMLAQEIVAFQPGVQQDTLRALAAAGQTFVCFGTSVNLHDPAGAERAQAEGRAAIDVCAAMGIPYIRVFGNDIPDKSDELSTIERVARGLRALCDYAQGTKVGVLLETHGEFNTIERVLGAAERVERANFGIVWDIAHTDKVYADDYEVFYRALKPYIRHTHIKDQLRDARFTLTAPGEGQIPILPIARMLLEDGYDGWFSLEWEKKWHPELPEAELAFPQYVALMRAV